MSRHPGSTTTDLADCAHVVFVIRDPFERLVSGFVQQVLNRALGPYPELEDSVRALTGRPRAELSFADFVGRYLGSEASTASTCISRRRSRTWRRSAIRRCCTTGASPRTPPSSSARRIAERYFRKPVNAWSRSPATATRTPPRRPAGELRRRLEATGSLPDRGDLMTPPLADRLARIYAADLALFARYRRCGPPTRSVRRRSTCAATTSRRISR